MRYLEQALADRFVEAFAERLHADIRKDIWGYAPDEKVGCSFKSSLSSVTYEVKANDFTSNVAHVEDVVVHIVAGHTRQHFCTLKCIEELSHQALCALRFEVDDMKLGRVVTPPTSMSHDKECDKE